MLHCDVSRLIKEIKCRLVGINSTLPLQNLSHKENKLVPGKQISKYSAKLQYITDTDGLHCVGMFINKKQALFYT